MEFNATFNKIRKDVHTNYDRFGYVIVIVLASSAIYHKFESQSGHTIDYEIRI